MLPSQMLEQWEKLTPQRVYLRQPIDGVWNDYTWEQCAQEVRRMAGALQAMDLPPASHIAILSKNCAHWFLADFAIWMAGHVSIPIYPNLSASAIRSILEHSESCLMFVGKLDDWSDIKTVIPPDLHCISFPYGSPGEYPSWAAIASANNPISKAVSRSASDLATIIYTSGTTGEPKGVMHTFGSITFSTENIAKELDFNASDRFFSYLPLAHVAERLVVEMLSLYSGGTVSFAQSLDTFLANLQDTQPTIFLGVPRIWEKLQAGVLQKIPQKKLDRLLTVPILSSLIGYKIRKGLGLNKMRLGVTGAAPTPDALKKWYLKIGLELQDGYGMTENFAYSHLARKGRSRMGWIGEPFRQVEARISPVGEILVKSGATMAGYYKAPELTADTINNSFLHTGDRGEIDSEGFLKISGRIKDIFKTSKGKYVAPAAIEIELAACPLLECVCVIGSGLPQPVVLVVLSQAGLQKDRATMTSELALLLEKINRALSPHERLSKMVVVKTAWTIQNQFLTPTMKLRRSTVEQHYHVQLHKWMSCKDTIVWESDFAAR
ncbi:MAG: AMP-binding protein [Deltaproteobacteria bacterium]|nr:AMP-binding protein [Deltaproteobacteria bacterium]